MHNFLITKRSIMYFLPKKIKNCLTFHRISLKTCSEFPTHYFEVLLLLITFIISTLSSYPCPIYFWIFLFSFSFTTTRQNRHRCVFLKSNFNSLSFNRLAVLLLFKQTFFFCRNRQFQDESDWRVTNKRNGK